VEFGKLITEFLIEFRKWVGRQNESQAEIARRLGISLRRIEGLRRRPTLDGHSIAKEEAKHKDRNRRSVGSQAMPL
jgi:hypothetical protein